MGAWSTSVTGNDVAQDMRDEFRAAFALNAPEDAVKKLDAYAKQALLSDEWTDYLYALADFMEKNGVLTEDVRARYAGMYRRTEPAPSPARAGRLSAPSEQQRRPRRPSANPPA